MSCPFCPTTSFGHYRKQWKCRRRSHFGVVDVSVIIQRQVSGFPGRWSMSLLCRSSFGASRATDYGGNHGSDSAVEQIVVSRATDHGGSQGSDSAVGQIVASRATDHGGNREGEQLLRFGADRGVVPQIMEEIEMVRRCRRCSSCGYGRPCDHAATWGSDFEQCWLWWR